MTLLCDYGTGTLLQCLLLTPRVFKFRAWAVTYIHLQRFLSPCRWPRAALPSENQRATLSGRRPGNALPAERPGAVLSTKGPRTVLPAKKSGAILPAKRPGAVFPAKRPWTVLSTERSRAVLPAKRLQTVFPSKCLRAVLSPDGFGAVLSAQRQGTVFPPQRPRAVLPRGHTTERVQRGHLSQRPRALNDDLLAVGAVLGLDLRLNHQPWFRFGRVGALVFVFEGQRVLVLALHDGVMVGLGLGSSPARRVTKAALHLRGDDA